MADRIIPVDWESEDEYWRTNYRTRPYAAKDDYGYYRPAYRYGYDAAGRYEGRDWADIESDLERDWTSYEDRGESTWAQMKHAVRDAWDRITGRKTVSSR
jgi:hypothetical protein